MRFLFLRKSVIFDENYIMNREIKFKVWDSKNKKFLDNVPVKEEWIDSDCWDDAEDMMNDHYEWKTAPTYNGRLIWLQYTGLKDKNGKEIYEGDVLKKHYGCSIPIISVAWNNERAMFIQNDGYNEPLYQLTPAFIEVIGNIYENPELIK